ncbi:unnamed protein product [Anisakis simplex]|uniref:Glycosyltransferase family 92 protein n=1 Tax=Anisakis simplex TaxID=6269 RepID=A0A0M3JW42_ANISI|nr:unnamed protein product [Anisakis simplex]
MSQPVKEVYICSVQRNVMLTLIAADKHITREELPIRCVSSNDQSVEKITEIGFYNAFQTTGECKWTLFIAVCYVTEDIKRFIIEGNRKNNEMAEIPFRHPVKKRHGVVACVSPLFAFEKWQLLLSSIEFRIAFGVSMQVYYIGSILTSLMQILHRYEEMGFVSIEKWSGIDIGGIKSDYDPNLELDFRNQASAHTDCLINFKESAQFIIFSDPDDMLFPQLAPTYLAEFQALQKFSDAHVFIYERFDVNVYTGMRVMQRISEKFSLKNILTESHFTNKWNYGKWVANPEYIVSAWIHWPGTVSDKCHIYNVPQQYNVMAHFRKWHYSDELSKFKNDRVTSREVREDSSYQVQFAIFLYFARFMNSEDLFIVRRALSENIGKECSKTRVLTLLREKKTDMILALDFSLKLLLTEEKCDHIQREFEVRTAANLSDILPLLAPTEHYYPIIDACYKRMFYYVFIVMSCPTPYRCNLEPVKGLHCTNAHTENAHHQLNSEHLYIHYPIDATFIESTDGCSL